MRARGLKPLTATVAKGSALSRPMRARGLKRSSTCGNTSRANVAPHAGAWIETLSRLVIHSENKSRPMRARGLKHHDRAL